MSIEWHACTFECKADRVYIHYILVYFKFIGSLQHVLYLVANSHMTSTLPFVQHACIKQFVQ